MDIEIEEKGDLYCVCVKVEPYNPRIKRKTIVSTGQVRRELHSRGYETTKVIQTDYIHNLNGITQGTWIFEKKVLDKSPKKVIIELETSVQPKPKPKATRKRRTRSSTKKVSTEE